LIAYFTAKMITIRQAMRTKRRELKYFAILTYKIK